MRKRTMDEMIKHFNDTVSAMDISRKDKMTILGMIVAIGYKHQDECKTYQDIIETDRAEIEWLKKCVNDLPNPVRCRDCIHLSGVTNGGTFFRCDRYDRWQDESNRVYMPLDGFCSYGQKKEG